MFFPEYLSISAISFLLSPVMTMIIAEHIRKNYKFSFYFPFETNFLNCLMRKKTFFSDTFSNEKTGRLTRSPPAVLRGSILNKRCVECVSVDVAQFIAEQNLIRTDCGIRDFKKRFAIAVCFNGDGCAESVLIIE